MRRPTSACSRSKNKHVYTGREDASVDSHSGSGFNRATIAQLLHLGTREPVSSACKAVGKINGDKSEAHLPVFSWPQRSSHRTRLANQIKPELHILSLAQSCNFANFDILSEVFLFRTLVLLLFACIANRAVWGYKLLQVCVQSSGYLTSLGLRLNHEGSHRICKNRDICLFSK